MTNRRAFAVALVAGLVALGLDRFGRHAVHRAMVADDLFSADEAQAVARALTVTQAVAAGARALVGASPLGTQATVHLQP